MKDNCKVMEDLFPNYVDDICSEESRQLVEEHLKECEKCKGKLNNMQKEISHVKVDASFNDELSKKLVNRLVTKKYLITGLVILVFFITGFYNIFIEIYNEIFITTPLDALLKASSLSNNTEIIYMEEIEKNNYIVIYEDGLAFGVGLLRKRMGGIFWSRVETSSAILKIGRPFQSAWIWGRGQLDSYPYVYLIKTYDSDIRYIALDSDRDAYIPNDYVDFEEVVRDTDRFMLKEVSDGYALFYFFSEEIFHSIPRGYTDDGYEIGMYNYRLIKGGESVVEKGDE